MTTEPEYIQGPDFVAEVVRTGRRKTATINVEDGEVRVVVPKGLPAERIERLLVDKQRWIRDKIALHGELTPVSTRNYVSGEALPYLGRNYRLKVSQGPFAPVKLVQGRLVVTLPSGARNRVMVKTAVVRWYKRRAKIKLREKACRYAAKIGVEPASVDIKSFKARWGSCTGEGNIEFNWRIVMAPNRIVDYVVVHELCHLKHHDHSANFWQEVGRIIPDYAECRQWLKLNAESLMI